MRGPENTLRDQDLDLIYESQERAAAQALVGLDWKSLDEFPPSFLTLLHFEASVIDGLNTSGDSDLGEEICFAQPAIAEPRA